MAKIRVLHPITRLIIGGAQENTMLTADLMNRGEVGDGRYQVDIVSGPQTGPEGSLIPEVRGRGIPLTILPSLVREVNPAKDAQALLMLYLLMRQGNYHIVHTHSSKAGVLGRLAARMAGVPLIVHTVHGWSFHDRMPAGKLRLYTMLEKAGAAAGHAMIVVSPHDIVKGQEQGIGRNQSFAVIRSGIELDRFGHPQVEPETMRGRLGLPPAAPVVGSVTRLSPQKGPLDLVAAIDLIYREHPDTWFVIVGDGPLRQEVEYALTQTTAGSQVILTGLRRDIPELMAMFDIFVLSSLWEGLPRVLPQAMATGLPVVCTRADGSAEAVSDGVNGYLVARAQPEALAQRVGVLLSEEGLRRRMGEAGQAKAAEFGARKMVQDIDDLYRRLLRID